MKITGLLVALIASSSAVAASPQKFTCELIKEKPVRALCISDRENKVEVPVKPVDEKANFIATAKLKVAEGLTDPSSAQFTKTFYNVNKATNVRCFLGYVNAKNKYGGYVGAQLFYAKQSLEGDKRWTTYVVSDSDGEHGATMMQAGKDCLIPGGELAE